MRRTLTALLASTALFLSGCSPSVIEQARPEEKEIVVELQRRGSDIPELYRAHVVERGDTLWDISATADLNAEGIVERVNEIGEVNGYAPIGAPVGDKKDPDQIYPGEILRIPGPQNRAYPSIWLNCTYHLAEGTEDRTGVEPTNDPWREENTLDILVRWEETTPNRLDVYRNETILQQLPLPEDTSQVALFASGPGHALMGVGFPNVAVTYSRTVPSGETVCGKKRFLHTEDFEKPYVLDYEVELVSE